MKYIKNLEKEFNMVKIISGYSAEGGSTTIFINLTNMFNQRGIDTTFYGPHEFHLNKCKSSLLRDLQINKDDILLTHFYTFDKRPNAKNVVLVCHEKWWFEIAQIPRYWDMLVFSHEEHRKYHSKYNGPYTVIPNPKEPLVPKDKPELDLVAGVIGTVEDRKQTHVSIERALADGCNKIFIYGKVNPETEYFKKYVKKYTFHPFVEFKGYSNTKQEMYDSIGRVYHSSKGEVACLVKDECKYTNTKFFGNEETLHEVSELTNDEIFNLWKEILKF
jgi:glycosyltransferase involved in cell wall biosynthesis